MMDQNIVSTAVSLLQHHAAMAFDIAEERFFVYLDSQDVVRAAFWLAVAQEVQQLQSATKH